MIEIMNFAAKESGKILCEYFNKQIGISTKSSRRDLVTEADLKSQEIIISKITELLINNGVSKKDIGFIAEEENYKTNPQTLHTFIIDPLDGTSSYVSGLEFFCSSIAYLHQGQLKEGVIFDPMRDITYYAVQGKGAYKIRNNQKVKLMIETTNLENATIAINTSSNPDLTIKMFNTAINLTTHVFRVREQSSLIFGLMQILENNYSALINGNCKLWDIAAAKLLLEEAGGKIYDWKGETTNLNLEKTESPYQIIAAHPNLIESITKYVK